MKKLLFILPFIMLSSDLLSQQIERVEVQGKIIVTDNDIEGVTVYNKTTEKGTITDFEGNFTIVAGLNDRIEFSALQLKNFVVIVDEGIVNQRRMTIFMVDDINKLPEVVVTPYDLSGNILVDANRVRTLNLPFELNMGSEPIDLTTDYKSAVNNPFVKGAGGKADMHGGDVIGLVDLLLKPLFKKNKKKTELEEYYDRVQLTGQAVGALDLRLMYTNQYISSTFGIPAAKVNEFIVYVEDTGLDYQLLKEGRELEFVDFLVERSKSFLALQGEED